MFRLPDKISDTTEASILVEAIKKNIREYSVISKSNTSIFGVGEVGVGGGGSGFLKPPNICSERNVYFTGDSKFGSEVGVSP